jgi:hypothetical protein
MESPVPRPRYRSPVVQRICESIPAAHWHGPSATEYTTALGRARRQEITVVGARIHDLEIKQAGRKVEGRIVGRGTLSFEFEAVHVDIAAIALLDPKAGR